MAHTSRAWVMDVGAGRSVAAGASHVVEYLLAPETIDVPRTPGYCAGLMIWRDHMIPVMDFTPVPPAQRTPDTHTRRAVILAYQDAPAQALRFGALVVTATPTETWVSDDMAGQLEQMPAMFRQVARACFLHNDQAIPILDARQLFTRPLARLHATQVEGRGRGLPDSPDMPAHPLQTARDTLPAILSLVQSIEMLRISPSDQSAEFLPEADVVEPPEVIPEVIGDDQYGIPPLNTPVYPEAQDRHTEVAPIELESAELESAPAIPTDDFSEFVAMDIELPAQTESELEAFTPSPAEYAMAEPSPPVGETASIEVVMTTPAAPPAPSTTVRSFQRLRAIAQDIESRERLHHPGQGRWWLLGVGVVLLLLAGALLFMPRDFSTTAPVAVVRDVAPNGLRPVSVPSTPAQPPQ